MVQNINFGAKKWASDFTNNHRWKHSKWSPSDKLPTQAEIIISALMLYKVCIKLKWQLSKSGHPLEQPAFPWEGKCKAICDLWVERLGTAVFLSCSAGLVKSKRRKPWRIPTPYTHQHTPTFGEFPELLKSIIILPHSNAFLSDWYPFLDVSHNIHHEHQLIQHWHTNLEFANFMVKIIAPFLLGNQGTNLETHSCPVVLLLLQKC